MYIFDYQNLCKKIYVWVFFFSEAGDLTNVGWFFTKHARKTFFLHIFWKKKYVYSWEQKLKFKIDFLWKYWEIFPEAGCSKSLKGSVESGFFPQWIPNF